jgi:hypothetical protein
MFKAMKYSSLRIALMSALFLSIGILSGCKNDDPSILKIFVRSSSNALLPGAQVVIIGDVDSNPATLPYVDTLNTNASGFIEANMDEYFTSAGESNPTGYFDVLVSKDGKEGTAYVRCRVHITTVETVFLMN